MCEILDYVEGKGVKKGLRKGVRKGLRKGVKVGVKAMIKDNLEMGYEQEEIIEKVLRYFSVSKETIFFSSYLYIEYLIILSTSLLI